MSSSQDSPELDPLELFKRCNDTELYQLARRAGHAVLPNMDRNTLIHILADAVPAPTDPTHVIDEWRHALMGFIIDHRQKLESQLTCPAKSMDPLACFNCVDAQVISCLVENKRHLRLIQKHKKR